MGKNNRKTPRNVRKNSEIKTSIIIPTAGRPRILERCLKSIDRVLKKERKIIEPLETIVIINDDNEKLTKEALMICDYFRKNLNIKKINTGKMIGSVNARNLGINNSSGEFLIFFDDDAIVRSRWFTEIFKFLNEKHISGVGGSEIKNKVSLIHKIWFRFRKSGKVLPSGEIVSGFSPDLKDIFYVDHLHGSNFATKRKIINKIGLMDSKFVGHYRDETDFTYRMSKVGKLIFNPNAKVIHKPVSIGGNIPPENKKQWCYWYYRNTSYFFFKHLYHNKKIILINFLIREFFSGFIKSLLYRNIFYILQLTKIKDGYFLWKEQRG